MYLPSGVPDQKSYLRLIRTHSFRAIEHYSNSFIKKNKALLTGYSRKWTGDPLHQWSRQWEYPFVAQVIQRTKGTTNILDAGSGITFFPYFLASQNRRATITCFDSDAMLRNMFQRVESDEKSQVKFMQGQLEKTSFRDKSFDLIYCVSVLEHSKQVRDILLEFYRILKPQGKLILTFDISLDGDGDISLNRARHLLTFLQKTFPKYKLAQQNPLNRLSIKNAVTTHFIASLNAKLLPWRHPILSKIQSFLRFRFSLSLYKKLTFSCVVAQK